MENETRLWLNEWTNAFDSLENAAFILDRESSIKWKWAAICIHHSLYSFCIAVQTNGNFSNVLEYSNKKKSSYHSRNENDWIKLSKKFYKDKFFRILWVEVTEQTELEEIRNFMNQNEPQYMVESRNDILEDFEKNKLYSFQVVLARVMDQQVFMGRYEGQKALDLTDMELNNIIRLHDFRNKFIHFKPQLSSIPLSDIQNWMSTYLKAIYFLVFKSHMLINLNKQQKDLVLLYITKLENIINRK